MVRVTAGETRRDFPSAQPDGGRTPGSRAATEVRNVRAHESTRRAL